VNTYPIEDDRRLSGPLPGSGPTQLPTCPRFTGAAPETKRVQGLDGVPLFDSLEFLENACTWNRWDRKHRLHRVQPELHQSRSFQTPVQEVNDPVGRVDDQADPDMVRQKIRSRATKSNECFRNLMSPVLEEG
jgi:hypothetical protein